MTKIAATEAMFTLKEVADNLKIRVERAREMTRLGRFPHKVNIGTKLKPEWRIPESDLEALKNVAAR